MMRRAKQKKHIFKLRYLAYLALVTTVIGSTTLASYAMTGNTTAGAAIAIFTSGVQKTLDLGTQGALAPGEVKEIMFNVTNSENGKVCEVPVSYEVQIETTKNLPLQFSLTGTKDNEEADESLNALVGSLDQKTLLATGGKLPSARSGGGTNHSYTLRITWPQSENAEAYSSEIDHLSVKIKTTQASSND